MVSIFYNFNGGKNMTLRSLNVVEYLEECDKEQKAYPSHRWGQVLFNVLYRMNQPLAESIRETDCDPFYNYNGNEEKIYSFFQKLTEWNSGIAD